MSEWGVHNKSKEDLTWLTGFWEGEGCVGCYKMNYVNRGKKYKRYILNVSVAQKEKMLINWVKDSLGYGSIYQDKKSKCWIWRANARGARNFLQLIRPYVKSTKRQNQIDKAIALDKEEVRQWN